MSGAIEVISNAHLFDQCTLDWFSVASILEDLTKLKARNPLIQRAYLKSDEAGCYHNSSVKGTSAAVCVVNESRKTLSVKKMEQLSSFHNLYEADGLRVWKYYGIGDGKYIPYEMLYVTNQVPTALQTVESQEFYVPLGKREVKPSSEASKSTESSTPLFECSKLGCNEAFESFAQLELHLDVGKHTASRLNQYDVIRRDWALKFSSVDNPADTEMYSVPSGGPPTFSEVTSSKSSLQTGWALSKPRSSVRFSPKVKEYLTARFTIGERTGRKADPGQVAADMRNAKNESNERLFTRSA